MSIRRGVGAGLAALLCSTAALAQKYDGSGSPTFIAHDLQEALASAYLTNPTLQAERAALRAVDENVPTAVAGWRPTVSVTTSGTVYNGTSSTTFAGNNGTGAGTTTQRLSGTLGYTTGVSINQPLYQGGRTTGQTHQAVNRVMAERANLIATEEQVFGNVVNAYVGVIEDQQLLQLQINNEKVLEEQLRATNDRFRVGEITRTDVAQAEAALASARAARQQAEGTLQTAQATYTQQVGNAPPPNLIPPQPLMLPVKDQEHAVAEAVSNNPNVINALFTQSSQQDAVDVAMAVLMPKLNLQGQYTYSKDQAAVQSKTDVEEGLITLTVPLYQGGAEYSAVRQAKQTQQQGRRQVDIQRRSAAQLAISNWQNLISYRASIDSNRAAIQSNIVALDGVERQAIVGTSTTLEVLQQQQTLLSAQVALVQSLSNMVLTSYGVASAIGRLTARDLRLNVPLYDETAYYNAVKDRLWGLNDYAVSQPGR
ncbi:TolC family outer membrane protein [Lichenicola cladoniae]|uniref:TolC family outer membrane protein n=1 Tax=Lichenicola cladoniae TaxID=1484109 RepID=A0A6M8HNL7_9PROT|nr:TolC family outer membrane protein [Acetobacteraceae bacterium]QKE89916.1 TolC family outer membrane protein [Lichenicola cladoniae]